MKLQSKNALTYGKSLSRCNFALGEQPCLLREIERLAMPMKWRKAVGQAIEERMRTGRLLDGKPAYLFGASPIYPRAQSFGYDLGTEANSE